MSKHFKFLDPVPEDLQVCTRCIYDSRIPRISFDEEGVCNYCSQYDQMMDEYPIGDEGMAILEKEVDQVKKNLYKRASLFAVITIFYNRIEGFVSVFWGAADKTFSLLGFYIDPFPLVTKLSTHEKYADNTNTIRSTSIL